MNTSAIVYQRLHNQKLSASKLEQPADVVRWLGAVQSQDFNAAKWALALRMQDASNDVIEDAFNRGEILRTHVLRPTWHFVAPEDIRWMLKLSAPRVNMRCGPNYRKLELDEKTVKQTNKAIATALKGGKHLTRTELKTALNRAGVAADDPIRLAHILMRAELDALVCSGPRKGKQFTYALLEERAPVARALAHDEALAELTKRYFTSHGPATVPDFVWWSGLTTNDARRGIAMLNGQLDQLPVDAAIYWTTKPSTQPRSAHSAHLLPAYDEYHVAYKNRHVVFDSTKTTNWDALGPTILIDGRIAGTWKGTVAKDQLTIETNTVRDLARREKLAIAAAAEQYATFLGVRLGKATVRG
ncbi:MAG TPA: winged helix DNA-binding domain-containing protein [Pyrinomonadaceae bacterium]|nr:winged helix DNA-binding domain-containing protein [Pyrinomonadaceae bacterium]